MSSADYQPNPWQRQVLDARDNLCVIAGAGSGKTNTLVAAVAKALAEGLAGRRPPLSILEIMALTFTEKAAAEMRRRLAEAFLDRRRQSQGLEAAFWRRELARLDRAEIGTIHGYALRLVRREAGRLNLPREVGVENDPLAFGRDLASVTADWLHEGEPDLLALLEIVSLNQLKAWLAEAAARQSSWGLAGLSSRPGPPPESAETLVAGFQALAEQAGDFALKNFNQDKAYHKTINQAMAALRARLAAPAGELARNFMEGLPRWAALVHESGPWYTKEGRRHKTALTGAVESLHALAGAILAGPLKERFLRLANQLPSRLTALKKQRGVIDFDDILILARRLLTEHRELRAEESRRYRLIIIDEFQDTNRLQADLAAALLAGPETDLTGLTDEGGLWAGTDWAALEPRFQAFGDPKQSIYRFRGGEIQIMGGLRRKLALDGQVLPLSVNYRSQKPLIDFFNAFFPTYLPNNLFGEEDRQEPSRPGLYRAAPVTVLTTAERPARRADQALIQAWTLRDYLGKLFSGESPVLVDDPAGPRPPRPGEVALLFRRLKYAPVFEEVLTKAGWPCQSAAGEALWNYAEVRAALAVLGYLWGENVELNLAALLRSPLGPVADETLLRLTWPGPDGFARPLSPYFSSSPAAWPAEIAAPDLAVLEELRDDLSRLRPLVGRRPPADLLETLLERRRLFALAMTTPDGPDRVRALQKFLALARELPARRDHHPHSPAEDLLARSLAGPDQAAGEEALNEGAIKIMSVHKAKGLEFPIVAVPEADLACRLQLNGLLIDRRGRLALTVPNPAGGLFTPPDYAALAEEEKAETLAEHARLFYVAATRARDHLVLLGWPDSDREGGGWLEAVTRSPEAAPFVNLVEAGEPAVGEDEPAGRPPERPGPAPNFPGRLLAARPLVSVARTATDLAHFLADPAGHFQESRLGLTRGRTGGGGSKSPAVDPELSPAELGNLFHAALEEDRSLSPDQAAARLARLAETGGRRLPPAVLALLAQKVVHFQNSPVGRDWLTALDQGFPVWHELPLWLRLPAPGGRGRLTITGAIDLFFISPRGHGHLVDYKLARLKKGSIELRRYEYQLMIYAQALRAAGFEEPLRASLFFAGEDEPLEHRLELDQAEPMRPLRPLLQTAWPKLLALRPRRPLFPGRP